MRVFKITLTALALGIFLAPALGCAAKPSQASPSENQVVTVGRGNLTIDITGSGNLVFSRTADLAFAMAGTVAEVLVAEGDTAEEKQVLAKLDTAEWEKQRKTLENQLTSAERQLTQKKNDVATKERALLQSDVSLKNAQIDLEKAQNTYRWPDIKIAQADVDEAQAYLDYALWNAEKVPYAQQAYWEQVAARARTNLEAARKKLDAMLNGADPEEIAIKKIQVDMAQRQLEEAQIAIETAKTAVGDAEKTVADAREDLDEAQNTPTALVAPFAGVITKVNIEGGKVVTKGTIAMIVADPSKFEASILVSEMDIAKVRLGGEASIELAALPTITLSGKVTQISPTAIIQAGVVNYKVKVEIQSPQTRREEQPTISQNATSGQLPGRLQQAIEEGRLTPEQMETMMTWRQQGGATLPGERPQSTTMPPSFQLREGLSVTINLTVERKNDVLLVPNQAITSRRGETIVRVLKDGATEERAIKTGISDWQYTEVTEGLSEGEKVVIPQTSATTSTSTSRGQTPVFPGMGRGLIR